MIIDGFFTYLYFYEFNELFHPPVVVVNCSAA